MSNHCLFEWIAQKGKVLFRQRGRITLVPKSEEMCIDGGVEPFVMRLVKKPKKFSNVAYGTKFYWLVEKKAWKKSDGVVVDFLVLGNYFVSKKYVGFFRPHKMGEKNQNLCCVLLQILPIATVSVHFT